MHRQIPIREALCLNPANALHCAQVVLNCCDEKQSRSRLLLISDKGTKSLSCSSHLRELWRTRKSRLPRLHADPLREFLPFFPPQKFALRFLARRRFADRSQPGLRVSRNPSVTDPLRAATIIPKRRPLSLLACEGKA